MNKGFQFTFFVSIHSNFSFIKILVLHQEVCLEINGIQRIQMPKKDGTSKLFSFHKQLQVLL